MLKYIGLVLLSLMLSACASTKFQVLEINSLASKSAGVGKFGGLEAIASRDPISETKRVNILFLHGVGWVENPDDAPLANKFIQGIANAYDLETDEKTVSSLCGRDEKDEDLELPNHIHIKEVTPKSYEALPGSRLTLDDLVCMDKQVLRVKDDLEYVIYRIFWDEIFWESLQYAFVGQDDAVSNDELGVAFMRRKYNRFLKDKLINFGFSDAVMYMGPAGREIRNATRGAICSAVLDAAGYSLARQGPRTDYETVCKTAALKTRKTDPFAFVAESLGSKITYDIMREAMTDGKQTVHDDVFKSTQIFMLANQIPLLSLNDLQEDTPFKRSEYADGERPTVIAFSEVNDFLTYELVPFYEQLYANTLRDEGQSVDLSQETNRQYIVDLLGFNMVDMRVEFAAPLIPLVKGFVDPLYAHNGHVQQPEVMEYMLCGADGKTPAYEGCRITPEKSKLFK